MSWRRCRLDWLALEERGAVNPAEISADTVFHYSIPALDEIGDGRLEPPDEIGSGKLLLSGGEVLISKLNPRLPRVLLAEAHDVPTLASTEFIALRPGPNVDERFLRYWLRSEPLRQMLNGATMSVTRSQQRVRPEVVTKSWLRVPSIDEQRAIADYLDRETARIDALIEKKRRMAELFDLAIVAGLEEELTQVTSRLPLRRLLLKPPQYGASESGEQAMEGWPRYIRITDLESDGALRSDDPRYLDPSVAAAYTLEDRDILIARSGATVGKVSMYREAMGPCAFAGYLIRFSLDPRKMLPELFAMWTRTADYWDQIRQNLVQATIENVSAEKYKDLLVPVPSVAKQEQLVRVVGRRRQRADRVGAGLSQQIALLQEHRQALITAAVTGELEIPGVAA